MENIKIAIVDNHLFLRKGLKEILENDLKMSVVLEAENGLDLIGKLKKSDALPQICLLEVNIPVMDGYQTCAHLTQQYPTIKSIALSAYDERNNIVGMISSGARGYLRKTAAVSEIEFAIREVHQNGFYHSDFITEDFRNAVQNGQICPIRFTERELTFLKLCCEDLTYSEIADQMYVSIRTVDNYRESLFRKTHTQSKVGLVTYAYKTGIVQLFK